jgi:hypothetical protein
MAMKKTFIVIFHPFLIPNGEIDHLNSSLDVISDEKYNLMAITFSLGSKQRLNSEIGNQITVLCVFYSHIIYLLEVFCTNMHSFLFALRLIPTASMIGILFLHRDMEEKLKRKSYIFMRPLAIKGESCTVPLSLKTLIFVSRHLALSIFKRKVLVL